MPHFGCIERCAHLGSFQALALAAVAQRLERGLALAPDSPAGAKTLPSVPPSSGTAEAVASYKRPMRGR